MSATGRPVAVVTGASAGVGRATALEFAARGFDVALIARGEAGLSAAAAAVTETGARALPVGADVSDFAAVSKAADAIEEALGPIDVWVNNAMTTIFAPFAEIDHDDFRRAVEVTFLGQVWGTKAALAKMTPRDRGAIVNVGSALAFVAIPLQSAYCASKFACRGFFESTRAELLHQNSHVKISMVHLPAVNTPQFDWCKTAFARRPQPVAPIYEPEVCARAIVDAAMTGRREKVLGAWNKLLVAAASVAPGVGNQFAALGAWDEQLGVDLVDQDRPVNLYEPVDDARDRGAHGAFGDRAHGFMTPSFLRTLPKAMVEFVRAFIADRRERVASASRQREIRSTKSAA